MNKDKIIIIVGITFLSFLLFVAYAINASWIAVVHILLVFVVYMYLTLIKSRPKQLKRKIGRREIRFISVFTSVSILVAVFLLVIDHWGKFQFLLRDS